MVDSQIQVISLLFSVIEDISEHKQYEMERQKLESQLRQSQKMEAIGTLASGIAHDFNNILMIIFGAIDILKDFEISEDDEAQEFLGHIRNASDRAKDLVQQILTFSRKEEAEQKVALMKPLVKEVGKLIRSSVPTAINIVQNISAEKDTVLGDPIQFHQVLMNLCTNSAYAMKQHGGTLTIGLVEEDFPDSGGPKRKGLKMYVKDTGEGIDAEKLARIFEPYFTTKPKGEGTGLGLAVVHGIVTSHQGKIDVSSKPGEGTTVEIYLPLYEVQAAELEENQETSLSGQGHILFVDDEERIVKVYSSVLKSLGYQVTAETNSMKALEIFQNSPDAFDLVISDLTMPEMNGIEMAETIHAVSPDLPIMICTGAASANMQETTSEYGIRKVLTKPYHKRELSSAIHELLDKSEDIS